ncbi:MAG: Opr family porin [Arcobacteraceae bacterium]
MRKISLVTSAVLLSTTFAIADSNTLKEAFANGTTSGDVSAFYQRQSNKNNPTEGYSSGSAGLNYETDAFYGFSASLGARANHKFTQKNKDVIDADGVEGDYKRAYQNSAVINVAALKYTHDDFFVSLGRQEIDLEWLGDYNEAVVAGITAIPDTTIVVGYTDRQAEIGIDVVEDFHEVSKKGAYVLDVKNSSIENVELNPYFYSVPDISKFYGVKVSYDNDMFGATAHYAKSNENSRNLDGFGNRVEDGDILNFEGRFNVAGVALAAGYIKTDKKGTGSMSAYGDNISPFEDADGHNIYGEDAKTYYGLVGYEIVGIELEAVYGQTKYDDAGTKAKEAELNLSVGYNFTEELSANIMYVKYNDKSAANDDYNKVLASVSYSF